jgi:hypothetical protein
MVEVSTNLAAASLAFSVLSFIVLTIGFVMWQFPNFANTMKGISSGQAQSSNISFLAVTAGALSPDIALLIGFISDIINTTFRYSVTSIVGILAIVLHWMIAKFMLGYGGFTPAIETINVGVGKPVMLGGSQYSLNPCTIRGLGMFELKNSPMGIAALAAIFMIYLLDMIAKRSIAQVGGYLGFSGGVFLLNTFAYKEARCIEDTTISGILRGISLPLIVGLASGGIAYLTMKTEYPSFLPLDSEPFDDGTPGKRHPTCGQPSENEFVCDAYKNGKKISTAVVS